MADHPGLAYTKKPHRESADFLRKLNDLTGHHIQHSSEYKRMCDTFFSNPDGVDDLAAVPFLPVGVFKSLTLKSIPDSAIHKVMHSSGTSGQLSKIYLDRQTADRQAESLRSIMRFWLTSRRPMLIVDSPNVLRGSTTNSARAAAILGLMPFGRDVHWLLDDEGTIDFDGLHLWLSKHSSEPLFIFGFTFMVWQHLIKDLAAANVDLSLATLFHGGGWKKLEDSRVTAGEFRKAATERVNLRDIHDYYGMVEQLGTIFVEASDGVLIPPTTATALIRDPRTLEIVPDGETGLVQVLSVLPQSYPGHSILTEDLGRIVPNHFRAAEVGGFGLQIQGRLPSAPARGCSDAVGAV